MKKDFLFPHAWRVPGWILTALFGAAGLAWSIDFVVWYTPDGKMQQVSDLLGGWIDEVIVIGLMAGLLLVDAFAGFVARVGRIGRQSFRASCDLFPV